MERQESMREIAGELNNGLLHPIAFPVHGFSKEICVMEYEEYSPGLCTACPGRKDEKICMVKRHEEQKEYPVVLISHMRLALLGIEPFLEWKRDGNGHRRHLLVIDEKPQQLFQTCSLTYNDLAALRTYITNKGTFTLSEVINRIDTLREIIHTHPNENQTIPPIPLSHPPDTLKQKFYRDYQEEVDWADAQKPSTHFQALCALIQKEGRLSRNKLCAYTRLDLLSLSQKILVLICDGTSRLDLDYPNDAVQFLPPVDSHQNLIFHIDTHRSSSKTKLKPTHDPFALPDISEEIVTLVRESKGQEKVYIVCNKEHEARLKKLLSEQLGETLYSNTIILDHYNNTRGSNKMRECTQVYIVSLLHKGPEYYRTKEGAFGMPSELLRVIDQVITLIQEIYRSKLRDHKGDPVHIYMACQDQALINLLKDYFRGAQFPAS